MKEKRRVCRLRYVGIVRGALFATLFIATTLSSRLLCAETIREFEFKSVEIEVTRFVDYSDSIKLSTEQKGIRNEALSYISSPCCEKHTANNCCGCQAAQSILGLSNFLIAQHNYNAGMVQRTVHRWIALVGFDGFNCGDNEGDACCTEQEQLNCKPVQLQEVVEACRIPGR